MRAFLSFTFKAVLALGLLALAVGGVFRLFFVDLIVVGHNGMAPSMIMGEEVLMWRGSEPELGDIAVCTHPSNGRMVVGRIVGRNGVVVETHRGQLRIAGQVPGRDIGPVVPFYDAESGREHEMRMGIMEFGNTDHAYFERENQELRFRSAQVGPGKVFLLGDNRMAPQHDSRSFGDVDPASCLGTIFMRWKPVDDRGADLGHGYLDIIP